MGIFQVPWRAEFSVGTGISDFTGLPAIKPWAFEDCAKKALNSADNPAEAVAGNVIVSKGIMSNTSHYKHALQASSSMSVKLWGANAHASSKLLTELELNARTVHYVVVCNFETETVNKLDGMDYSPALSTSARNLLLDVGPDKWAEQYGTHFIAGYVRGGTYLGKATITDSSTQSAHEFRAAMGTKFGRFAAASVDASMNFGHLKVTCSCWPWSIYARLRFTSRCKQCGSPLRPTAVHLAGCTWSFVCRRIKRLGLT